MVVASWLANSQDLLLFDACYLSPSTFMDGKTLRTMLFDLIKTPIQIQCTGAKIC
jgi:hypothetical protein